MNEIQPLLLRERQAAALYSISRPTFRRWVMAGRIPEGTMIDGCRVWHIDVLKQAAENLKRLAG